MSATKELLDRIEALPVVGCDGVVWPHQAAWLTF